MSLTENTPGLAQLTPGAWTVDVAHTKVGFTVRHMMVSKVRGTFEEFTAEIVIGENPLESTLNATVQMASIDTGNADRDGHLRTNDFFAIEQFPTMELRSTGFAAKGDDFVMHADLTIKGVTKPVTFDLEFGGVGQNPWGQTVAGFTATASIDRKDFGVEYNAALETGGVLIGDKVQIELDVEINKA
jgi:polyisoprenoid-binding protein YceI